MNPIALALFLGGGFSLFLIFTGRWDSFIDEITGHSTVGSTASSIGAGAAKAAKKL